MVKLLFGRARSGKSFRIISEISELCKLNKDCVLIVPEQFTLESERQLLRALETKAVSVPVYSFTRLASTVSDICGGDAGRIASDSDRVVLMSRAVEEVRPMLKFWQNRKTTTEFCTQLITAINELKTCAAGSKELELAAEKISSGRLKSKAEDLCLIFNAYTALLNNRFIDPIDDLTRLYENLQSCDFFKGKNVFFDSFKGFTGQQYRIISRIIETADNCTFAFAGDANIGDKLNIFAPVNLAARKIVSLCREVGVECQYNETVGEPRFSAPALYSLEKLLYNGEKPDCAANNIEICACRDVNDEAVFAATKIRNLVRKKGYRYRDFVVIARDADMYSAAIETQFSKNGIPVFIDKRYPAASLPLMIFAHRALKCVQSLNTKNILGFLKSGLTELTPDEVSTLENYVFVWKIEGKRWLKDWTMDPEGLKSREESERQKTAAKIAELNALRKKAIAPLTKLRDELHGGPEQMGKAVFKLVEREKCAAKLKKMVAEFEASGEPDLADITRQSWDCFVEILDSTVNCAENESINDFISIFESALSFATLGRIPQHLDEVVFGSADRIRPSRPKIVFVLGLNRGVFPAVSGTSGVFTRRERAELIRCDLPLPDRTINAVLEESYLVYSSVCCASDRVYLSYSAASGGEYSREPSRVVEQIIDSFDGICLNKFEELSKSDDFLPETPSAAFSRLAGVSDDGGVLYESISKALDITEYSGAVNALQSFDVGAKQSISSDTAEKVYGNNISVSATSFDIFNRCRFSYFCKYGLNAKVLRPAEIDVAQKGLIVHFVLEKMFNRFGKEISSLPKDAVQKEVSLLIKEYVSSICGTEEIDDPKFNFTLKTIETIICEIVLHLGGEFAQSLFEPVACELGIGPDEEILPPEIPLENGGKAVVRGSVDRLDKFNDYIRIVDYKTGSKKFKLGDIIHGLNMQMLLYLYCVVSSERFSGSKPAGILYLPARRSLQGENKLCMSGVILSDNEIAAAMERDNEGKYIPKYSDASSDKDNFLTEDEFQKIFAHLDDLLKQMGNEILKGDVSINPTDGLESDACKYCDYAAICRLSDTDHIKASKLSKAEVMKRISKEESGDEV